MMLTAHRQWRPVRLECPGAAVAAVGVVHQAGDLPRAYRAGETAAEWRARADAPYAEAGGHHPAGQQHEGTAT